MNICYLKADSRAALLAALGDWWDAEREHFHGPHPGDALHVIGAMYTQPPVDEEGNPETPPEALPGFHANLMLHGEIPAAIEAIRISKPENPRFVFAGHE